MINCFYSSSSQDKAIRAIALSSTPLVNLSHAWFNLESYLSHDMDDPCDDGEDMSNARMYSPVIAMQFSMRISSTTQRTSILHQGENTEMISVQHRTSK